MSVMRDVKARLRNRDVRRGLVIVVTLFLIFEVTVRYLPPDGVTVTTINYNYFTPSGIAGLNIVTTSRTTLAHDAQRRAAIDRLNNGFNTAPLGAPINYAFGGGCMTLSGYTEYQVTFTWHDLPVRVWTTNTGCPDFTENSGGIPNPLWVSILENDGQPALHALQ
jgi:hypothetical protein